MVAVRTPTIALVGNPNTGKTTLFNDLAGMNQRVGNYPGVTVETKKGKVRLQGQTIDLIDLPGTYSLAARSPDEMVAVDVILGHRPEEPRPDAVVVIVDASNLDRNLYLMTQVMDLGVPVIIALNMMDVARGQGIDIDVQQLSKKLGLPVVPTQANKGVGIDALKEAIDRMLSDPALHQGPVFPEAFENEVDTLHGRIGNGVESSLLRRLLLDVNGYTEEILVKRHGESLKNDLVAARERLAAAGCSVPGIEARTRYGWIRQATADCVKRPQERIDTWTDRLDRVLTHKVAGTALFLAVMFLVFQSINFWAGPLMDLIGTGQDALADFVLARMDPGPLRSLIVEGVIAGVGGVVVFLPQIMILFALIAILEDCGYMARAAFLMDRLMARAGLNGKSFIPMLSSVACAVPGIMAARVIENRRDRLATILVAPLMSCSARLPVYMLLAYAFLGHTWWLPGLVIFGMYCLGLIVAPIVAFCLKRTLLKGETPVFVMEMPLYRMPSPGRVLRRSVEAGWMFVRRAGTLILASMIVIWALLYFPTTGPEGTNYAEQRLALEAKAEEATEELDKLKKDEAGKAEIEAAEARVRDEDKAVKKIDMAWKKNSILGRTGQIIEPVVRPLGWDWRVGMAALASFPAREVMVGTLGIIFGEGEGGDRDEDEYRASLGDTLRNARWQNGSEALLFTVPVALSVMVFFALCCQCVSTLVIIRRETNSWGWPVFTFVYMTVLAYIGALIVYQVGILFA